MISARNLRSAVHESTSGLRKLRAVSAAGLARRVLRLAGMMAASGALGLLAACGGGSGDPGSSVSTSPPATMTSIEITSSELSAAAGTAADLQATAIYSNGTHQDVTGQVTWQSSDTTVANVATQGSEEVATAGTPGSTTISASLDGETADITFTVTAAVLTTIEVAPVSYSVPAGVTHQFTATGEFSDGTAQNLTTQVTWSSSNTAAATISDTAGSNGLVTGEVPGASTITATMSGISGSASLTVTAAALVSIQVTPASPSVAAGLTTQFTATGTYTNNSTQDITQQVIWGSSNTAAATISNAAGSNGLATTAAVGSTTIEATSGSVSASASLSVTAATLVSLRITPSNAYYPYLTTPGNQTFEQFTATGVYTDGSTQNLTNSVTWSFPADQDVLWVSNASGSNGQVNADASSGSSTLTATIPASGSTISGSTSVTIAPALGYAYVTDKGDSTVWEYLIAQDGTLLPYTGGGGTKSLAAAPSSIAIDPTGTYAFVTSSASSELSESVISHGVLGPATNISLPGPAYSIAIAPVYSTEGDANSYAYVATDVPGTGMEIAQFSLSSGGALAPLSPATALAVGSGPGMSLALDSTDAGLFAASATGGISQFQVGANGTLSVSGSLSSPAGSSLAINPVSPGPAVAFLTDPADNLVYQYLDALNGTLLPLATPSVAAGTAPDFVVVDPAGGNYAYVINQGVTSAPTTPGTVSEFTVSSLGLAPMTPASIAAGNGASAAAIDPQGRFLYVVNTGDDTVSEYTIDPSSGALTPMNVPTVQTGSQPNAIVISLIGGGSQ